MIKSKYKFIVLEGIDGSGKSTQAKMLADFFKKEGKEVINTFEHQRKGVGLFIEKVLNKKAKIDPLALEICFMADRCDHTNKVIKPELEKGKIVICDRYYWSTVAYSEKENREWILEFNRKIGLNPDIVVFIDVDPGVAVERIEKGREVKTIFEKEKSLLKNREAYYWLCKNDKKVESVIVDGGRKQEEIFKDIIDKLS